MGWYSGIASNNALGTGQKISNAVNNTFHSVGGMGWGGSITSGVGIGAGIGAIDGGLSYDGTVLGGAFKGATMGAVGGAAFRVAAGTYKSGGSVMDNAFSFGTFSKGWNKAD